MMLLYLNDWMRRILLVLKIFVKLSILLTSMTLFGLLQHQKVLV